MVAAALNPNLGLAHHSQANGYPHFARVNLKCQDQWWLQQLTPLCSRRFTLKRMGIRTLSGRTLRFLKISGGCTISPQFGLGASLSGEWASALCPGELKVSNSMVTAALNPNLGLTHHSQANGHPHFARANLKFPDQWWLRHLNLIWA